ncbi:hypothetical protein COCC4DRAFT_33869, partial [Bipolaris maydis ATCC 48331]
MEEARRLGNVCACEWAGRREGRCGSDVGKCTTSKNWETRWVEGPDGLDINTALTRRLLGQWSPM